MSSLGTQSTSIIAFSAVLTQKVILGQLQEIKYDKVLLNIGHGYDPRHGHFTAPTKGVYLISVSTMKNHIAESIFVELVKDGVQLVSNEASTEEYNAGSHTIPVLLEQGEMVWVRHYKLTTPVTVHGEPDEPMCSFSGVLLYTM